MDYLNENKTGYITPTNALISYSDYLFLSDTQKKECKPYHNIYQLLVNQKDIEPEFQQIINNNFWNMLS